MYLKPKIHPTSSYAEMAEHPGVAVFHDPNIGARLGQHAGVRDIYADITRNPRKFFSDNYKSNIHPFGNEGSGYDREPKWHADTSPRVTHLCAQGAVSAFFSEFDDHDAHLAEILEGKAEVTSLKHAFNVAIQNAPPNASQIVRVDLLPGTYVSFNGISGIGSPHPHLFEEVALPRLGVTNF